MKLIEIPRLDELAQEPNKAADLQADTVESLLARCTVLQNALVNRLLALRCVSNGNGDSREPDRLLTAKEAGGKLCRSEDGMYRHANEFPFTVRDGRQVRFSQKGIEKYIRQRVGR